MGFLLRSRGDFSDFDIFADAGQQITHAASCHRHSFRSAITLFLMSSPRDRGELVATGTWNEGLSLEPPRLAGSGWRQCLVLLMPTSRAALKRRYDDGRP